MVLTDTLAASYVIILISFKNLILLSYSSYDILPKSMEKKPILLSNIV